MKLIQVELNSLSDICFDRFIDHSGEKRPPEQKLYLIDNGAIVLPGGNIEAFLFGRDPKGCAVAFEGKKGNVYRTTGQAHVTINEPMIPILADGQKVKFDGFGEGKRLWVTMFAPRTKSGSMSIKQEVNPRQAFRHPWSIQFSMTLIENTIIDETKLFNWFTQGGVLIGLGNHRPTFGRFTVGTWEVKET